MNNKLKNSFKADFMNCIKFIKKYKIALFITILFTFLIYGFKLINYSVSIDTENIINFYDDLINSWYSIGRYSLGFIKFILKLKPFNYYISNLLLMFFFPISIFILYYIFDSINKKNNTTNMKIILFSCLIVSCPIYAEQFNFTLQCAEVAISFFIFDIGLYFFFKSIKEKNNWLLIPTVICFIENLGCYQSFISVIITAMVAGIIILFENEDLKIRDFLALIFKSCIVLLISLIGYLIISKCVMKMLNINATSYLFDQILWFKQPIKQTFISLMKIFVEPIKGNSIFYNISYTLSIFIVLKNLIKNKNKKILILLNILILIAPFSLPMLLGESGVYRSQLAYPIAVSFILVFMSDLVDYYKKYVFKIIVVATILFQVGITEMLFISEYLRYNNDVKNVEQIMETLKDDNIEDKTIIFIGSKSYNNLPLKGETIGKSFFEWDANTAIGSNRRIHGLFKSLGYNYFLPTQEQYDEAIDISQNLSIFPDENSFYYYDKIIVIRMS